MEKASRLQFSSAVNFLLHVRPVSAGLALSLAKFSPAGETMRFCLRGKLKIYCLANLNMRIFVKARPNSKKEEVQKLSETEFLVSVKEPPEKGKANEAIRNALAVYFKIASSRVKIISGWSSRNKIIDIST